MKIVNSAGEVKNTRVPENALKISDLHPGDVFRFRNGSENNIYIMGMFHNYFHLLGNQEYQSEGQYDKYVILYPDAFLTLGDEQELRDED